MNRSALSMAFAVSLAAGVAVAQEPAAKPILADLDADQNGLYDDTERKAVLDVLQKAYPVLEGTFDHDGDGKVTIEEMTKDRHPITKVLQAHFVAEEAPQIPWAVNLFPEWIATAYFQEDVQPGKVTSHTPHGLWVKEATPVNESKLPTRSEGRDGIRFAANSGQQLTMSGQKNARWEYRWTVLTFRVDSGTGTDAETLLVDINQGNAPGFSSPKIWYHMDLGLHVQYLGRNKGGLDQRILVADNVIDDGETWNVLVCGIRFGQIFAELNGVPMTSSKPQPPRFATERPEVEITSVIGDPGQGHMEWSYDALIFGMTEPSEAMVDKLTGWAAHRLGIQANLPEDHPYRENRPVMDAEDFPTRYLHDDVAADEWRKQATDKSVTRVNAGGERVEPKGFERVFYDDFRAYRLSESTSGEGDLWVGPGFNTSVGMAANLVPPGRQPNAYPYDAENQHQILSLVPQSKGSDRWRGSQVYTVNDLGHGYTWKGPKVFRIRVMFPEMSEEELPDGLFPAFWSYDPDFLFWRTDNRIEIDYFELEGKNGWWLNGLSTHLHYSHLRTNTFAKQPGGYKRAKVYGGHMTEEESGIPGGYWVFDGKFHTWEFVIDDDMTYINITVPDENGNDRWVEVVRTPTSPLYLQNLNLQMDYALKERHAPLTHDRYDMVVDFVEVLQKAEQVENIPAPFTARPELSGSNTAGSTVTVEPNVEGVSDLRYFWYADGYPLTWGPSNTYEITDAEAGKEIRVMVKAVGARDMPEAWSNTLK